MRYALTQGHTQITTGLTRFQLFPAMSLSGRVWLTREFDGEMKEAIQFPDRASAIAHIEAGGDPARILIVAGPRSAWAALREHFHGGG